MAIPVLITGKSGSGKSASLRNLPREKTALISVLGKPLPFRGAFDTYVSDDYEKVKSAVARSNRDVIVVDDAGYLMTNMFMRCHANPGKGGDIFSLYNNIGDSFWNLIQTIVTKPGSQRVYILMHEEKNDMGDVKPKTIGKLVDEKVCLEGMFTICLRCKLSGGKHVFVTQSDGFDTAKSPMDMFPTLEIDNDLSAVDKAICDYYEIGKEMKEAI